MTKLTAADIQQAEQAQDNRRQKRNKAFRVMHDRDRGWVRFSNGALMEWHTNTDPEEYIARTYVPAGNILLTIGKEKALFDVEELRKWIRWG